MYEHRKQRLLSRRQFARRVVLHVASALLAVVAALGIGVAGYHYLGGLSPIDSLLNASMILGGMGPVDGLASNAAKLFASAYALFSGLVFIGILGVILAPFAHRLLHTLHIEESKNDD
jgi:hypothetical protein